MGATQSSGTSTESTGTHQHSADKHQAYALAMKRAREKAEFVTGGCGCGGGYFGGAKDADPVVELREYEASLAAKTKENTIRSIARALSRVGVKVDPEAELDVIVKTLVDNLPHPRKGKSFKEDAKVQDKICRTVAGVLNDEFTPGATKPADKLIDTSLGAETVCQQVSEWVHSFTSGVHAEFLDVYAGVKRVLRNVEVLEQVMKQAYSGISERASKDAEVSKISLCSTRCTAGPKRTTPAGGKAEKPAQHHTSSSSKGARDRTARRIRSAWVDQENGPRARNF